MHTSARLAAAAVLLAACGDLSTPAELAEPQLLALVADPPGVAAGAEAALTVLVAGPDGLITPARTSWSLDEAHGASLRQDAGGWVLRAPDSGDERYVRVDVVVELDDGTSLPGQRTVQIGGALRQPAIDDVLVDGRALGAGATVELAPGGAYDLSLAVSPAPGDAAIYSWFATVGELSRYRRIPATLETPEPGAGVLIVVYRDGLGGVAHRAVDVGRAVSSAARKAGEALRAARLHPPVSAWPDRATYIVDRIEPSSRVSMCTAPLASHGSAMAMSDADARALISLSAETSSRHMVSPHRAVNAPSATSGSTASVSWRSASRAHEAS